MSNGLKTANPKPLFITDTILRDAHQSQAATRMKTEDMLPACELLNSIGYWSLECWGGATFDSCMRFLDEDPWERLRILRKALPDTKLQMLLRGQNILGYRNYSDDVVDSFCKKSIENGIDVVRIFDALNDTRNIQQAVKSVKEYGGICEPAMSYTTSPIHNEQYFVDLALKFEDMGADVICIKDMANLLLPMAAHSLVTKLKERVKVPIHLHTHNTTGTGDMVYLMAALAGVDIVDTALSPLGNGTSQPATEPLVATLRGHERDTGLDLEKLSEVAKHFRGIADRLTAEGIIDPKVLQVDTNTLIYQVPGGMLSNLISQLKEAKQEEKYYDVLREIPKVREEFGYPPLVTPTSQIVGTQAVMNVLSGERYKMVSKESKGLMRGEYGQLPGPVDADVQKTVIGDDTVITCRPADLIPPEIDKLRSEISDLARSEEDVLSYALFPQVAKSFFERRLAKEQGLAEDSDELIAVLTAAINAYRSGNSHPLIRSVGTAAGAPASNPTVRNS
ncbi:MAG: oxaloacetate decarboxylase subunit alpha [Oscillospiraceae bacterium]|jgi:oxaloacetate decarboxylase alpha subunit|nr:oxaloacetate decarboxylase subunit alpha [Oscillospiraceae bacterium]